MTGRHLRGALEARKIHAGDRRLTADVTGEIEIEEGVLVIRRIHVVYHIQAPADAEAIIERVHEIVRLVKSHDELMSLTHCKY